MKRKSQILVNTIIGIDIHPDSFSAVRVQGSSIHDMKIIQQFTKISMNQWNNFLQNQIPKNSVIVCEAGCNSFESMKIAQSYGHQTFVLNSIQVGQIAKAYCKNDPKDALRTAKVYLCGLADNNVWIPDEETSARREILSSYENAVKDCTRYSNRIKSFLTEHNVRYKKKIRAKDETKKELLLCYHWSLEQKFLLTEMFNDFMHTKEHRERLLDLMNYTVLGNKNIASLMRLCGIRLKAAYALMAAIGDINRFKTPKSLVAYIGLAPSIVSSGNKSFSRGLQRGGKTYVKSILIQSAHAVLKSKNSTGFVLRKWGCALMLRKGKHVALGGIARKLLVAVWYALKGYFPELLEEDNDVKTKIKKIAQEITLKKINSLGYKKVSEFVEEYTILLLSQNPEVMEQWKNQKNRVFSALSSVG